MQWALTPTEQPAYPREMERIATARTRLERLECLHISLTEKAQIINTGCLSPLDYSPIPLVRCVEDLRKYVKRALGQVSGSPEIVFHVLSEHSIDPIQHWMMSAMRLFAQWAALDPCTLERILLTRRSGRVAVLCKRMASLGWTCTVSGIKFPDTSTFSWTRPWDELRLKLSLQYRKSVLALLVKRRPMTYEGLEDLSVRNHVLLLNSLSPHQAVLMVRIWSGCVLTAARRNRLDPTSDPSCTCGSEHQTVPQLLYHCPHVSPPSQEIRDWGTLPPAFSSALLCPNLPMPSQVRDWKEVCKRALAVLTMRINVTQRHDWRGHTPQIDTTGQVAFCTSCFISRKTRDQAWIASEPCAGMLRGFTCMCARRTHKIFSSNP